MVQHLLDIVDRIHDNNSHPFTTIDSTTNFERADYVRNTNARACRYATGIENAYVISAFYVAASRNVWR